MPYLLYRAFQWGSKPPLDPYWVKITMSELDGLYNEQIQDYMQKISFLTQYLGNLMIFDSKLKLTKYV